MLNPALIELEKNFNTPCSCGQGVDRLFYINEITRLKEQNKKKEKVLTGKLSKLKNDFDLKLQQAEISIHKKYKREFDRKLAAATREIAPKFIQKQESLIEELSIAKGTLVLVSDIISNHDKRENYKAELNETKKELKLVRSKLKKVEANYRLLKQQYYGKKTERRKKKTEKQSIDPSNPARRPRGHQKGKPGHGPRKPPKLPIKEEIIDILDQDKCCSTCHLPFQELNCTDDSDILEVEVKSYIRKVKRKKYKRNKKCRCTDTPPIVRAAPKAKLFTRAKLGISIWVEAFLAKYNHYIPLNRYLNILKLRGLSISQGTVTGGFKKIAHLFSPVCEEIKKKNQSASQWHTDETRWEIFEKVEGKKGTRWYLWVFLSKKAATYIITPHRDYAGVDMFFNGVTNGFVNCDRYSVYKKLDKDTKLTISYCWAHTRRDFIDGGKQYPEILEWSEKWLSRIGNLYYENNKRVKYYKANLKQEFDEAQLKVETLVEEMKRIWVAELQEDNLHEAKLAILTSMKNHWHGLLVFVKSPEVSMDNNLGEQALRGPVTGRKDFYGAGSLWSAKLAADMFSIFGTLDLWDINSKTWLTLFLEACANNHGALPDNWKELFLPWRMSEDRMALMKSSYPDFDTS